MLIKWITCWTSDRAALDRGQRAWAAAGALPGFLGQGGGWSRREPRLAHVFGCWADRASYEAFMTGAHDEIAAAQLGTYDRVETRLFERVLDIAAPFRPDGGPDRG